MKILNNWFIISLFLLLWVTKTFGQTYNISTGGSVSTCSGTIYDSGGSGGSYGNNENYTMTFCSSSGNCIRITFTSFNVENNYDRVRIYDGPTTAYAFIGGYDNSNPPTTITSTTGCLTIRFTSDVSNVGDFEATISCVACPTPPAYNNPNGFIYSCNALFYDAGGPAGQYANNQTRTTKICSNAGNCVIATFSSFATEAGVDFLNIYDGNSTAAPLIGSYSGATSPGTITSSSGCLTFRFSSDLSVRANGWAATISCGACATPPPPSPQNCNGATTVCSDQAFSGNSSGSGSIVDLNSSNDGCLAGENQSSWYYFSPATSGVIELNITPANGTDDYDFAIWGPLATIACPPVGAPLRCSYSAVQGTTGLRIGSGDVTEGALGDSFVNQINALAGEKYILVVDNFSESNQPFTLDWTLSSGATLGCTPLPIELLSFTGKNDGKRNIIEWTTSTEINNDHFNLERSIDGKNFESFANINGAGNSTSTINYIMQDNHPYNGLTYYRLKQTDFNGNYSYSKVISIESKVSNVELSNVRPNPTTNDIMFDFYSSTSGKLNIQVIDFTGRIVINEDVYVTDGKTTLNGKMNDLAKGIYSLKVTFGQNEYTSVNKVIKQ